MSKHRWRIERRDEIDSLYPVLALSDVTVTMATTSSSSSSSLSNLRIKMKNESKSKTKKTAARQPVKAVTSARDGTN